MPPNFGAILSGGRGSRYNNAGKTRSTETIEKDTERARASRRRALLTSLVLTPIGAVAAFVIVRARGLPTEMTLDAWLEYALVVSTPVEYAFAGAVVVLAIGLINLVAALLLTASITLNDTTVAFRRARDGVGER